MILFRHLFHSLFAFLLIYFVTSTPLSAQDFNCLDCHDNFIANSVHKDALDCSGCHDEIKDETHVEGGVKKVDCANCHEEEANSTKVDIHARLKVKNPPTCKTCHGTHEIKKPPFEPREKSKEYCSKCHQSKTIVGNYHQVSAGKNQCLSCHKDVDTRLTLPSSVHKNLACGDCHNFISNNLAKHPKNLKVTQKADCYLCHEEIAAQHKESIHGIALSEGIDEAAKCWNCHGSHDIKPVSHPSSKVFPSNIAKTCATCHDDPELAKKYNIVLPSPGMRYSNSIHGKLIAQGRTDAPTCSTCHGVHDIKNKVMPGSKISTFNSPALCGQCHKQEAQDYMESIHWIRAKKGFTESPVCDYCHSEHSIEAVSTPLKKTESKKLQQETCVVCHENPRIAKRFGKEGTEVANYVDSYHGLAVLRGDEDAAMCVDCHAVHKILPQDHPGSTVNTANVTETCKSCHPDATPIFAQSYSHKTQIEEAAKVESIVDTFYFWFVVIIIGGMVLHNLLIFSYEIRKKKRLAKNEITIPRLTKNEVFQHVLLFTSFFTLAITGFALKFYDSWWAYILQILGMTETVRQNIHRAAALIMMGTGVYHIVYLLTTARGRDVLKNLLPNLNDFIDLRDNILYYLRIKKHKPSFDKYDYTEKAEYWALIWGTIVMGVTGLFLWFPTLVGDWAPTWWIKVSELIHFYEAILATLAILVWHWFFVIFHPHEYPMSLTWIDGKMTLRNYRHHHERHFRRILLEWKEYQSGKRELNKVSHSTLLFADTLKKNGLNPDQIFDNELLNDAELRDWLDKKLNPIEEKPEGK